MFVRNFVPFVTCKNSFFSPPPAGRSWQRKVARTPPPARQGAPGVLPQGCERFTTLQTAPVRLAHSAPLAAARRRLDLTTWSCMHGQCPARGLSTRATAPSQAQAAGCASRPTEQPLRGCTAAPPNPANQRPAAQLGLPFPRQRKARHACTWKAAVCRKGFAWPQLRALRHSQRLCTC